jgi:hypothetical protein
MKILVRTLLAVAVLTLGAGHLRADGGYSFAITNESKKIDGETTQTGPETHIKENWAYKVTLENKSFKDAENVEIKYITFMKPDMVGLKATGALKLKRKEGVQKVPLIKNFDKFMFVTDPMTLTGTQLQAGWVYTDGSNPRAKDALKGLWLRVFVNGQQVMEFVNPTSLKSKETWERQ